MKNIGFLLLGIVLVFSFGFNACDNGSTTEPDPYGLPRLNSIYLITYLDKPNLDSDFHNERTSFSVSEGGRGGSQGVGFFVIGENLSPYSLGRLYVSFKKGDSIIDRSEYPLNISGASEKDSSGKYTYYWFWFYHLDYTITQIANDYSFEVYVVDTEGNRSNTLIKTFAITAD